MGEPDWKKLKLSLERPYKDDDGQPMQVLLDVTPDGQLIYEAYVGNSFLHVMK
jgi:mediator of RNA polymerase II transcription subunit 17